MDKFLQYLYSIGYKVYDSVNDKNEIPMPTNWSCHGPATVFLVKDGDFSNPIYWGIANGLVIETTATLRFPLPFKNVGWPEIEETTIRMLQNMEPAEVYKLMYP